MKNLKYLFITVFSLALIYSCRSEEKYYEGDTGLHFNFEQESKQLVYSGESKTFEINFGTLNEVSQDSYVSLIMDVSESDNFQPGAIEILNGGQSVIEKGSAMGKFEVKLNGDLLSTTAQNAVFRLESDNIENAVFNQTYTLNASQVCPISNFVGTFVNDTGWWWNPGGTFNIVEGTAPNSIVIKDFFDAGIDFNLTYDPDTFVVSFDPQDTGYYVAQYDGNIIAQMKASGGTPSTLDPCSRDLDLYVEYIIEGVGSYGEKNEHFTGQ